LNVKNNRLLRQTDERIVYTVYQMITEEHRPIAKITVREICERAEIHRSTFYAHYRDVYDLVERVEQSMSRQLTETFFRRLDAGASARDCFTEIFAFIRDHREFYLYYLTESKQSGVLALAWETIRDRADGVGPETFGAESMAEMEYHGVFFLVGMTAMVRLWLQRGCREEPEALYELLLRQGAVQQGMIGW
jgi:AcrR family transcriptional regulator